MACGGFHLKAGTEGFDSPAVYIQETGRRKGGNGDCCCMYRLKPFFRFVFPVLQAWTQARVL